MYSTSHSFLRIAQKALAFVACAGAVLVLTAGPVLAGHSGGLHIDDASWDGTTLTADGGGDKPKRGGGDVRIFDADTDADLGLANLPNSGNWDYSGTTCADSIYVTQDEIGGVPVTTEPFPVSGPGCGGGGNQPPVLDPIGNQSVTEGNDLTFTVTTQPDPDGPNAFPALTVANEPAGSTFQDLGNGTGTFTWLAASPAGSYPNVTFTADDGAASNNTDSETITITVNAVTPPGEFPIQTDFKMLMNYELGMHCTGFEFAYCCVLPVYNSILTQVVKPNVTDPDHGGDFARLLEGGPSNGGANPDVLGREVVLRDLELDDNGDFKKYVLRYWHNAQPRANQGGSRLISQVEGNTLLSWNTIVDAASVDGNKALVTGDYGGATNVVLGNGSLTDRDAVFTPLFSIDTPIDNYQNAIWNHLYIYDVSAAGVEGQRWCKADPSVACFSDQDCKDESAGDFCGDSKESRKIRLGLDLGYPTNFGPAGHGMEGLLTYSGEHGTVVYTAMKVLENLPITLTSPRIWEALGLPLTPFEDELGFFADPGAVGESSIRPFVEMNAQLYNYDPDDDDPNDGDGVGVGDPVKDHNGDDVIGFGTAPIDIPNCERCHSASPTDNINSPNSNETEWALVQEEMNFWKAYYPSMQTGEDWYARLKGAAISILSRHDSEHGTEFTKYYVAGSPVGGVTCNDPNYPASCNALNDPVKLCSAPASNAGDVCTNDSDCTGGLCSDLSAGALLASQDAGDPRLDFPQNTRLGHESVMCHKCHADNVIAVVKSANCGPGSNCSVTAADDLFSNIAPTDPVTGAGHLILPLTEAIHHNHRNFSEGGPIHFADAQGRDGGCQGCHPAHRSDGVMTEVGPDRYPITLDGNNAFALADNRDAAGGCFVGRDVHSNPFKDDPILGGADTPEHLNPTGQWLADNVANDGKGIWCTNCHSQAGQELWRAENVADLVNAVPGQDGHVRDPGGSDDLAAVVQALNDAVVYDPLLTVEKYTSWLDPKSKVCSISGKACAGNDDCDGNGDTCEGLSADGEDHTHAAWAADPGMCSHLGAVLGGPVDPAMDAGVATIEVEVGDTGGAGCSNSGVAAPGPSCGSKVCSVGGNACTDNTDCVEPGGDICDVEVPAFWICGSQDADNNFSVNLVAWGLTSEDGSGTPCEPDKDKPGYDPNVECFEQTGFCTTPDCVAAARAKPGIAFAVPVPYSAATDGRDHWLAGGEPHCADCHAAPYTEQSGNINAFAPFNYPRKAGLMRYSRGHQDITCQGCHESIHGLYPVTPPIFSSTGTAIDSTSYAQAASLNHDGSHGPLKCGACHEISGDGLPTFLVNLAYNGQNILQISDEAERFDAGVSWMHTFTGNANPVDGLGTDSVCLNCHEDRSDKLSSTNRKWTEHAKEGKTSRLMMDNAEIRVLGHVAGDPTAEPPEDPLTTVCTSCHGDRSNTLARKGCSTKWRKHLTEGRASESVWEYVSQMQTNTNCGW